MFLSVLKFYFLSSSSPVHSIVLNFSFLKSKDLPFCCYFVLLLLYFIKIYAHLMCVCRVLFSYSCPHSLSLCVLQIINIPLSGHEKALICRICPFPCVNTPTAVNVMLPIQQEHTLTIPEHLTVSSYKGRLQWASSSTPLLNYHATKVWETLLFYFNRTVIGFRSVHFYMHPCGLEWTSGPYIGNPILWC